MKPVLVLAAVQPELALITGALQSPSGGRHPAWPYTTGKLGGNSLICCVTGPGTANAAGAAAAMIERHKPDLVLITGCGGAFPGSGLGLGDLAVASDELFADLGVLAPCGWLDMQQTGLPLATIRKSRLYNRIPLARHHAELAMQCADRLGVKLARGCFATVATCSGTAERGLELAGREPVICENMEGAAVALTCLRYGIACCEIRGISNLVEDRDRSAWDIPGAVEAAQRFTIKFLEGLSPSARRTASLSGVIDTTMEGVS